MKVKTYRGRSVQQAISQIKSEIGPDAVIMSTKRVPKNRTNPYGEQIFEVTASVPEEQGSKKSKPVQSFNANPYIEKTYADKNDRIKDFIDDLGEPAKREHTPDEIYKEILSIKDILFSIKGNEGLPEYIFKFPGASSVYSKLIESGVSSEFAKKVILKSYSREKSGDLTQESFRKRVFVDMMTMLESADPFETTDSVVAAAFVGPTGVGKTTTIAKIAADLTINRGKKVGLISVDNYRVGALEQLKTYAAILGIPCMPAFSRDELKKAISRMQARDVILIDTAGVSSFDEEKLNELKEVLDPFVTVSTHLVLSITSSRENLQESSRKFSELNPSSYIFTKMDETSKRGVILDQIDFMNLPVSYITDGQRVPEDISGATRKTILKKIFTEN